MNYVRSLSNRTIKIRMRWQMSNYLRKNAGIIVSLALFHFVFLGIEYLFDNRMAYVANADAVVLAQSYILGASAVGFLIYPMLARRRKMVR